MNSATVFDSNVRGMKEFGRLSLLVLVLCLGLTWKNDEFLKYSVDDLVPILRESEVTSGNNLECNMHVTILLPTTDVEKEDFVINSPLREQVVDFLMENEDVAGLPRHLVKRLFSHLVKNLSSTKRMSDEPLGDDSKPRSYDVTFLNTFFDFNDDYTLCYDNPLFNKEFEDISSMNPPKLAPLNYEPLGNPYSMSRSLETSDLNLEEPPLRSAKTIQFQQKLTMGRKMRVMETPSFGFHHMPAPRPAAYSPKEGSASLLVLLCGTRFACRFLFDRKDLRACFQSSNHSISDHFHDFVLGNSQS
nr:hypothetical protein [Tanacetum cinerariifolium]